MATARAALYARRDGEIRQAGINGKQGCCDRLNWEKLLTTEYTEHTEEKH